MITDKELRKILDYDPRTGRFIRKTDVRLPSGLLRAKAGDIAGSKNKKGYWRIGINGKDYQAHRLAWLFVYGEWPSKAIDHINGVKDDNRISNLRLATARQNTCNAKKYATNTSGRKGATWHRNKRKWQSHIKVNGKTIYLGLFESVDAAHAAYVAAAHKYHGEYARAE